MAEKYNTPKTPTPGKEESQVLTAKYTPIPEIAAGMIGMASNRTRCEEANWDNQRRDYEATRWECIHNLWPVNNR